MIFVITVRGHGYTIQSLIDGAYGFPTPQLGHVSYEEMLRAIQVPKATYIFADLERLSAWELQLAAHLYLVLNRHGLRCLNDPARAMARVELLRCLHAAGINPFQVWRADERPRPTRFPVFIRHESDHGLPLTDLIADSAQLDQMLADIRGRAIPLRGLIVLEHCPAPYGHGLWHKWGTFRVGDALSVDHISVDDKWLVKYGDYEKLNDEAVRDEHDAVMSNRYSVDLARVFDLAQIEFGRADHATVDGRTVVYEINTNPYIGRFVPDSIPMRLETQRRSRHRLAAALEAIDTKDAGVVQLHTTELLAQLRSLPSGLMTPRR